MLLYRLLTIILSPIIFGHIIGLSIKNKQIKYFWQRLGFNSSHLPKNCLWFHCASVGEVNTLMPLLKNIHKKDGELKFIITTNTITGEKIIAQKNLHYLYHCYLPFDWRHSINRFLTVTEPSAIYIMETEIWPNLFTACNHKNIPISIINARLSKKTTSANRWIKTLLKNSLQKVNKIYARSEENAQAFLQLGAPKNIIKTVGNLKFTTAMNSSQFSQQNSPDIKKEYVLLASTHNDEELQFFNLWKKLNRRELLIIVPRHPERGPSIAKQLDCQQLAMKSRGDELTRQTDVFILDTIGELKNYFSKAKVVIMGGSFTPIGGHNILEPAAFNKAIITGPYMENFKDELNLMLKQDAIIQVTTFTDLEKQLIELLDNLEARSALQDNTATLSHNVEQILSDYTKLILEQ